MRIQHNITAMNSYRNFSANNSSLSKNLEKLSSGYAINRAGDDAAGLAISEKMRVQLSGLEGAKKNAKDGISLIQTAEGALTETHDMLNRMVTLAEQSANGTYQDELDREQLQKEIQSLKSEIDRIADSTNFNGLKLLDGSLSTDSTNAAAKVSATKMEITMGLETENAVANTSGTKAKYGTSALLTKENGTIYSGTTTATGLGVENGDSFKVSLSYTDADGKKQAKDYTLKIGSSTDGTTASKSIYLDDGSENGKWIKDLTTAGVMTNDDFVDAVKSVLTKDQSVSGSFDVGVITDENSAESTDSRGDHLTFEARKAGTGGASLESLSIAFNDKSSTAVQAETTWDVGIKTTTKAEDSQKVYNLANQKVFDLLATETSENSTSNIEDAIINVNGEKFVFIAKGKEEDPDVTAALREAGVTHWVETNGTSGKDEEVAAADVTKMANKIAADTGLQVVQGSKTVDTTTGVISFTASTTVPGKNLSAPTVTDVSGAITGVSVAFESNASDADKFAFNKAIAGGADSSDSNKNPFTISVAGTQNSDATHTVSGLELPKGWSVVQDGSDVTKLNVLNGGGDKVAVMTLTQGTFAAGDVSAKITAADISGIKENTELVFRTREQTGSNRTSAGGLTLQIGDTSDEFNRLTVSVGDMHSEALGLGKLDISTQAGATTAIDTIKNAVNIVSDTRGTLGALQNRLDHTINNIGVMTENIQSAESNIRDTDVAEEMMKYTKNSILNQSAQAMLAQANQLPQGVLQLLQ